MTEELNELKYLEDKFSHDTGFTVPDGYFEGLTARVMSQLPEAATPPRRRRNVWLRPMIAAAASLALIIAMAATILSPSARQSQKQPVVAHNAKADTHEDAIDATADYIMMDRDDIYSYITE